MLHIATEETSHQTTKKWIIFWGLLTWARSTRSPPARSDLSGVARTRRLSLLWLVAATITLSTVGHNELGMELRMGPMALYASIEDYPTILVR